MTNRQKQLYNLLMSNPGQWFTQKEICEAIEDYEYIDDDRNHCVEIGNDRIEINESDCDKIITTRKHCFKIATYEEYQRERNSHIRRLKSQVKQLKAMDRKYHQDGQADLYDAELNELVSDIDKYHETFIKTTFAIYYEKQKKVWVVQCQDIEKVGPELIQIKGGKYNKFRCPCDTFYKIDSLKDVNPNYKLIDLTKKEVK